MLHDYIPPRINLGIKELFKLDPDSKIGDWLLFENYTVLRNYGLEVKPHQLPTFLTPRTFFFLEFIRQKYDSDHIHFISINMKTNFKIPNKVGPYVVKGRSTKPIVEKLLNYFNLQLDEEIKYNPHQIISKRRR